ncbi:Small GTP-binding protein [Candidatus Promineifilum breve]|uniref:Small GTP-binding protein n=1 Tax=Candidatus Promineifilum breve TaxID=1806508 RepID=A0A160SZQ2_9CHLR|nr:Rab family GTPase [Candidatus Promineifilum breve]CUS02209.2 Small GTP-binding protein [Candidatus Promineifilum breve]
MSPSPGLYQKKVCLLGEFAVGKTSLIRQYVEGRFDEKYLTTVGTVVTRKVVEVRGYTVNLLIWDLAGGRDFGRSRNLVGLAGALLVCDLTRADTLDALRGYAQLINQANPDGTLIVLANKADLVDERVITDEQLCAVAHELQAPLFFTSAKTGDQVESAFTLLADRLAPS